MKRSAVVALCVLLCLPGCGTTGSTNPYEPMTLPQGKGAVVFTVDRHGRAVDRPFAIHAVRYDPQNGKVLGDSDDDGRGFVAVYSTKSGIGRDAKHWAFELEPGHYAISSVDRVGVATQPTFSGGNLAVVLVATVIATAASHAIAAAEHESHEFVRDGRIQAYTPTFTVAAGQISHIGDFAFSSESRTVEKLSTNDQTWSGPNATGLQTASLKPVTEIRTLVDYSFDPATVGQYLRIRKLDRYRIDHQRLEALVGRRVVIEDFPGENPESRTPVRATADPGALTTTTSTAPPASPGPVPLPASATAPAPATAPADGRTPLARLQERFLAGQISKEEYERERARLAAGS